MNAREMADIILTWPDGSAANYRKFIRKVARTFPKQLFPRKPGPAGCGRPMMTACCASGHRPRFLK
jgi:hypothetical protein